MSKKNMESTRELMGTSEVTDYSIRTYKNEELVLLFNPKPATFPCCRRRVCQPEFMD